MLDQQDGHSGVPGPGGEAIDHRQDLVPVLLETLDETLLNVDDDQSRRVRHDWRSFPTLRPHPSMPRPCEDVTPGQRGRLPLWAVFWVPADPAFLGLRAALRF
jgi:hypothetical protein